MILQPSVELTKIHYYENRYKTGGNVGIPTVSAEVCENNNNKNIIIKNNIFGHRWVLKINESSGDDDIKKRSTLKLALYILVFCCLIVAVCFGIYFSFERDFKNVFSDIHATSDEKSNVTVSGRKIIKTHEKQTEMVVQATSKVIVKGTNTNLNDSSRSVASSETANNTICGFCPQTEHICLKTNELENPKCVKATDRKDPTGCGGLCRINIEFCQMLDVKNRVYQCSKLNNSLRCPNDSFNCGNMCISQRKRCDGTIHCSNHSDEEKCDCDLKVNFHCGNGTSCLTNSKKCDGKVDCWDKSDEKNCTKACEKDEITCLNGQCIPKDNFCDGQFQCDDKSDEPKGCQI